VPVAAVGAGSRMRQIVVLRETCVVPSSRVVLTEKAERVAPEAAYVGLTVLGCV